MLSAQSLQQLALVMVAAGIGAILAESQIPDWAPYIIVGFGMTVAALSLWAASENEQRQRQRDFHIEYAPAVSRFLAAVESATRHRLVYVVNQAPWPYPGTPIEAWDAMDHNSTLKKNLEMFYRSGEPEDVTLARKTMKMAFADWSEVLGRLLSPPGFRRWFERIKLNHQDVFILWLFSECALARARGLYEPDLEECRPLIRTGSVSAARYLRR